MSLYSKMCNSILCKRSLSSLLLVDQIKPEGYKRQAKNSSKLSFCQICGDTARIVNYGALSCQSCKTFFRRNGLHPQNIHPCLYKNSCEIIRHTRRACTACRLAKCFLVGMSSDLIRKEERKQKNYSLISKTKMNTTYKDIMSTSKLCTYDQSHDDQFLLFNYEQKILLNVTSALEIYSAIPKVRTIIENSSPSSFDLCFNVVNTIEIISLIYTSMKSFVNSTPDFQILTINEQCSLLERNFNTIVILYSVVVLRDTDAINNSKYIQSFTSIYGLEMMVELTRISKQLDLDFITIKLMLIILAFSSNCSIIGIQHEIYNDSLITGTHRLLGSQNVYVKVLWKYLICQYGYYKAALRFTQFIKLSLDLTKYSTNAYMNNIIYHKLVNDFNQEIKQLLIANRNEEVHLWGTT